MLIEDSIRFYSSILPHLFKYILNQSRIFATEALNEHEQMMRMRGRPKVLLARDFEEASALYHRYGDHMLGIISDVRFPRVGEKNPHAGFDFARGVHKIDPFIPIILESQESDNRAEAEAEGLTFLQDPAAGSTACGQKTLRLRGLCGDRSEERRGIDDHRRPQGSSEADLQHTG